MRVRLVVVLALLLPTSGCFAATEEGPRLAQPTDTPAVLPDRPAAVPMAREASAGGTGEKRAPPDYDDPGFRVNGAWKVGDAWSYESNTTPVRYRYVEVRAPTTIGGRDVLEVYESVGVKGYEPDGRTTVWIDAVTGAHLRAESDVGVRTLYSPGGMNHWLYRNATTAWNETGRDARGASWREEHALSSTYEAVERVRLPWGSVDAGRVEHRDVVKSSDAKTRTVAVTRWISADLLYDVRYGTADVSFSLVGARVGGREVGVLVAR